MKIYLPHFNCDIYVYKHDELDQFEEASGKSIIDSAGFRRTSAMSAGRIYIGRSYWEDNIIGKCYHEASEVVDWLMENKFDKLPNCLVENDTVRQGLIDSICEQSYKYVMEE